MSDAKKSFGFLLFPDFELLDLCGPLEMFGNLQDRLDIVMVAETAGPVAAVQGNKLLADYGFAQCPPLNYLLVPGGIGTRQQVENPAMLEFLRKAAGNAEIIASVCTGSGLLAAAGLLDGRRATSNKMALAWAMEMGPNTEWVKTARWVDDGDRVTSSGVSAGIDMALALIERLWGAELAERMAQLTEYDWHRDPTWDPFAKLYGWE